jgi:hypothetical protein
MAAVRTPGGLALRKASERVKARRKVAPVAQAAESLLCRGLGIIKDGEVCTEAALQELARRFEGQIDDDVFAALRALFQVGDEAGDAIDDALIGHGGAAGLDLEDAGIVDATAS